METNELKPNLPVAINWQMTFKVAIIGAIAMVLLIPKFMIIGLIDERAKTAEITKKEIMQKWSDEQIIRGPVLTIPYIEHVPSGDEEKFRDEIHTCYILPETLSIDGNMAPEKLHRSIYETVVYNSKVSISGKFSLADFEALKIAPKDILWDKAQVLVSVNDLRGINDLVNLSWNGKFYVFSPGMDNKLIGDHGISAGLPGLSPELFPGDFNIELNLKGSESLMFAPIGKTTEATLQSVWKDPGFEGIFLPDDRNINETGFNAHWKVLSFNRNFPQEWKDDSYNIKSADFGVRLLILADHYQKSSRSAKYGILVILFIFLAFFLNEIITKQKIHPFQYILVGFSILIFYLLLLSISEQIGFNPAYLISAVAVIVLVLAYSRTFMKKWINSIALAFILAFSFGFIFILMQLESYALLVGSIGLFCVLGLTMFFTRKINWYNQ